MTYLSSFSTIPRRSLPFLVTSVPMAFARDIGPSNPKKSSFRATDFDPRVPNRPKRKEIFGAWQHNNFSKQRVWVDSTICDPLGNGYISHLKEIIDSKLTFQGDMLVPRRVYNWNGSCWLLCHAVWKFGVVPIWHIRHNKSTENGCRWARNQRDTTVTVMREPQVDANGQALHWLEMSCNLGLIFLLTIIASN